MIVSIRLKQAKKVRNGNCCRLFIFLSIGILVILGYLLIAIPLESHSQSLSLPSKYDGKDFKRNMEEAFIQRSKSFSHKKDENTRQDANIMNAFVVMNSSSTIFSNNKPYKGIIFLSWYLSSRSFHYLNYKSLESVLTLYPEASIQIRYIAPEPANYYKVGDILSKMTFQKYGKQGFSVATIIHDQYSKQELFKSFPGYKYYKAQLDMHFKQEHINKMHSYKAAPFHFLFYDIISYLLLEGGMYSDFSWFHLNQILGLNEIDKSSNSSLSGFHLRLFCRNHSEEESSFSPNIDDLLPPPCLVSMLMAFTRNHTVLQCMQKQYENDEFLDCLTHDLSLSQGAFCISAAMKDCFDYSKKTENIFERSLTFLDESGVISSGFVSCYYSSEADKMIFTQQSTTFLRSQVCNSIQKYDLNAYDLQQIDLQSIKRGSRAAEPVMVWLGSLGYNGGWNISQENSLLSEKIKQNNKILENLYIKRIQKSHKLLNYDDFLFNKSVNQGMVKQCFNYARNPARDNREISTRKSLSCSINFVIPGFMKAGTTYLFDTIANHPLMVKALRGVSFKETGCYSESLMKEEKRSHLRMDCFPFVESHDNVFYGDGTIFYATRKEAPKWLFEDNPNIKVIFALRNPIERLISHHRFDYGGYTKLGYPNLNDCIYLTLSFNSSSEANKGPLKHWLELARLADDPSISSFEQRKRVEELVLSYQKGIVRGTTKQYYKCSKLIFDSLYFPAIFHWFQIIPKENIRVLNTERLQYRHLSKGEKEEYLRSLPVIDQIELGDFLDRSKLHQTKAFTARNSSSPAERLQPIDKAYLRYQFNAIFRFLGVPELAVVREAGRHESERVVPEHHQINQSSSLILQEFFQPFNSLLRKYVKQLYSNS